MGRRGAGLLPEPGSGPARVIGRETSADFYLMIAAVLVACSAADAKRHWSVPFGESGGSAGRWQALRDTVLLSHSGRLRGLDRETGSALRELWRTPGRAGMAVAQGRGGTRMWVGESARGTGWRGEIAGGQ